MQLEQQLADAQQATRTAEEKNAALEKQNRRIVAMLKDALRTGMFPTNPGIPVFLSGLRRMRQVHSFVCHSIFRRHLHRTEVEIPAQHR
jgi:hypothetical protein